MASWAKENFDLIMLLVGLLGVVVSVISLFMNLKRINLLINKR